MQALAALKNQKGPGPRDEAAVRAYDEAQARLGPALAAERAHCHACHGGELTIFRELPPIAQVERLARAARRAHDEARGAAGARAPDAPAGDGDEDDEALLRRAFQHERPFVARPPKARAPPRRTGAASSASAPRRPRRAAAAKPHTGGTGPPRAPAVKRNRTIDAELQQT